MLNDFAAPATKSPQRLRLDNQFIPCAIKDQEEFYANGIFEFNISRILVFLNNNSVRYPVELIEVSGVPAFGVDQLNQVTVSTADLRRPVLLAEISPARFNLIDGHHRIARARLEGVASIPVRRIRCPDHMAFLTSVRAYQSYVEYWNGKVHEMEPRRRRIPAVRSR